MDFQSRSRCSQTQLSQPAFTEPGQQSMNLRTWTPFDLPPELVGLIVQHLSCESIMSLALTNKQSFSVLSHRFPDLVHSKAMNLKIKKRFLRLLEHDLPQMLLCPRCNHLYDWTTSADRSYLCPTCGLPAYVSLQPCFNYPRWPTNHHNIVDVILRQHGRGQYTAPVSFIDDQCCVDHNLIRLQKFMQQTFRARIIKNELYDRGQTITEDQLVVLRTIRLTISTLQKCDTIMLELDCLLCHCSSEIKHVVQCAVRHQLTACENGEQSIEIFPCRRLIKCGLCETDYRVAAKYNPFIPSRVHVTICAYRNLGGRTSREAVPKEPFTDGVGWDPVYTGHMARRNLEKSFYTGRCSYRDAGKAPHDYLWFHPQSLVRIDEAGLADECIISGIGIES